MTITQLGWFIAILAILLTIVIALKIYSPAIVAEQPANSSISSTSPAVGADAATIVR